MAPRTSAVRFASRLLATIFATILATILAIVPLTLGACSPPASEDGALARGDVAYATADTAEALAEYQLAAKGGGAEALARVGHTYAEMGRVNEARDFYSRAVQQDKRWGADQAGSDLLHLARVAQGRSDPSLMTSAVETALQFLPGLSVEELALPLARQYFKQGQFGQALPYYQRALSASTDSAADVLMEVGTAYEQVGDCGRALDLFERYRGTTRPWDRTEIDWQIGTCSLQLAGQRRLDGERDEALRLVDRMLELGEPRNQLPQAWFEKGEILSEQGRCDAAVDAFRRVRTVDPSGVGAIGRRADQRVDEIRFAKAPRPAGGRC